MQTQTKTLLPDARRPNSRNSQRLATSKTTPAFMGFSQRELRRMVAAMMG